MEIYERIALLRNNLNLTQDKFGEKLGVSRDTINNIEHNRLSRPEQKEPLYRLICQTSWDGKYVNEQWLRSGTGGNGNMYLPEDMTRFYNIGKLGDEENEFKQFYLNMMMHLPDAFWDYIYKEFKRFSDEKRE